MKPVLEKFSNRLKAAQGSLREQRAGLLEAVRQDPEFQRENITLYDFDTLDNIDMILQLVAARAEQLDEMPNKTMIDIGCANGELGFAFEEASFAVALLDKSHVAEGLGSHVRQNAPLVASIIARSKGSQAVIFDQDVDEDFDPRRVIDGFARSQRGGPAFDRFGLGVMVGVLYHLKNPYSVVEKLTRLCDYMILGTWVADCLPDRQRIIEDDQVVFLLEDRQLAADPSNYWIFTPRSFRVLVERCGWRILAEHSVTNPSPGVPTGRVRRRLRRWAQLAGTQPGVSPPDDVKQRMILFLKRKDLDSPS